MTEKRKITEDDANNLNFGLPLVLTLILFITNGILFSLYFAENILELIKMYLFFAVIILLYDFIRAKLKKDSKTIIHINAYKNLVLSMVFVLFFLGLNFVSYTTIFETKTYCKKYHRELRKYTIPPEFKKFYEISREEKLNYLGTQRVLHVKLAKSKFGYKILTKRTFEKF
jgi:hypothetical protein